MKNEEYIRKLRQLSRELIRELGILQLNQDQAGKTPRHWHALIEINQAAGITIKGLSEILLLSFSATSRVVDALVKKNMVETREGLDKREKRLYLKNKGKDEIKKIDEFSNRPIEGAIAFMDEWDKKELLISLGKYCEALKKNRLEREEIKVLTLPSSRTIRKQVRAMIEKIQIKEFSIPITDEINISIMRAEETYHFEGSCNFWYVVNAAGEIVGSIGLKRINRDSVELKKMFVDARYRGQGVAQKLLKKAVLAAAKHKFKWIYLGTVNVLMGAQRFYEKTGFEQIVKKALPEQFEVCPVDSVFFKGDVKNITDANS